MIERVRAYLSAHTPRGRYEQYRSKHAYLLEQTTGEARYMFEKTLDRDARRYANRKVAGDILGIALLSSATVILGIELKKGTLKDDAGKAYRYVASVPDLIKSKWNGFLDASGKRVAQSAVAGADSELQRKMQTAADTFELALLDRFTEILDRLHLGGKK